MATSYFATPAFSQRVNTSQIRPPSSALLTIDSEDRFQNGVLHTPSGGVPITGYPYARNAVSVAGGTNASPYDFTIVKNTNIMNGFFTQLALTEINFEWGIPNINIATNKIIVNYHNLSTNASGSALLKLFDEELTFATPYQIASNLQREVRTAGITDLSQFVIQYGEPIYTNPSGATTQTGNGFPIFRYYGNYNLSTGVIGSNIAVSFSPLNYNNYNSNSPYYYPFDVYTKQLFDVLGFNNKNSTFQVEEIGKSTLCTSTRYIDIICTQLAYNQNLKDSTSAPVVRDSLCRLYLSDVNGFQQNNLPCYSPSFTPTGCAPSVIYRQFQTPKIINWLSAGSNYQPVQGVLRFEVVDDAGSNLTQLVSTTTLSGEEGTVLANTDLDTLNWSATLLVTEN